jgi:hypothetical protein
VSPGTTIRSAVELHSSNSAPILEEGAVGGRGARAASHTMPSSPAHADASSSGRISAVHREARKWQVANRQTSSGGPIGQRSISSRLGLGSTAVTGVALAALLGMPCQPSLVQRFQDSDTAAVKLPAYQRLSMRVCACPFLTLG